jgi:DNA-binding XRE family transcriptional regulator
MTTMLDYCCSFDFRWNGELAKDKDGVRWCFRSKEHADAFQALFGGERIDLPKADDATHSTRAKLPAWLRRSRSH